MKRRLHFRVALIIAAVGILLGVSGSYLQFLVGYQRELAASGSTLRQLGDTVKKTAAIAAYLDEVEIAKEVVQGLGSNDIVAGASLRTSSGMRVTDGETAGAGASTHAVSIVLDAPFTRGAAVGELVIFPRQDFIETRARSLALERTPMTAGIIVVITLLVFLVVARLVIRPMRHVARGLSAIKPGDANDLPAPRGHEHDDIGGLVRDINALLALVRQKLLGERALRADVEALERRFRMIFERASAGLALIDADCRLIMANPAARSLLGDATMQGADLPGGNLIEAAFRDSGSVLDMMRDTLEREAQTSGDFELQARDADGPRWAHCLFTRLTDDAAAESPEGAVIELVINEVTERKRRELRIRRAAEYDALTGLINRGALLEEAQLMLEKSRAQGGCLALGLIDLDGFKPVNDTHGHQAGDKVLVTVAERLQHVLRQNDLAARIGGDEFVIVFVVATGRGGAQSVARKLLAELGNEIVVAQGIEVTIGASIGFVLSSEHGGDLRALLALADAEMYRIKRSGKNNFGFVEPPLAQSAAAPVEGTAA